MADASSSAILRNGLLVATNGDYSSPEGIIISCIGRTPGDGSADVCEVDLLDMPHCDLLRAFSLRFEAAMGAIEKGRSVVFRCAHGHSRAPSLAIALLMCVCKLSFPQAYALVRLHRSCIRINPGFLWQLKALGAVLEIADERPQRPREWNPAAAHRLFVAMSQRSSGSGYASLDVFAMSGDEAAALDAAADASAGATARDSNMDDIDERCSVVFAGIAGGDVEAIAEVKSRVHAMRALLCLPEPTAAATASTTAAAASASTSAAEAAYTAATETLFTPRHGYFCSACNSLLFTSEHIASGAALSALTPPRSDVARLEPMRWMTQRMQSRTSNANGTATVRRANYAQAAVGSDSDDISLEEGQRLTCPCGAKVGGVSGDGDGNAGAKGGDGTARSSLDYPIYVLLRTVVQRTIN
jgi:hypothetical protein